MDNLNNILEKIKEAITKNNTTITVDEMVEVYKYLKEYKDMKTSAKSEKESHTKYIASGVPLK